MKKYSTVIIPLTFILFVFVISSVSFAGDDPKDEISVMPWVQVYSNYNYNLSGYPDWDSRFENNDFNSFELTRTWLGVDALLPKNFSGRLVVGGSREPVYTYETTTVPTGEPDDPATEEDESVEEVVREVVSTKEGKFEVWVTYAYVAYRPFKPLGIDFGMISNAYNTRIYKYWRHNYVEFPNLFKYKMTRSLYGDLGIGVYGDFPAGYGGYKVAFLNGEGKKKMEFNKGKALEARLHVNPFSFFKPMKDFSMMGFFRWDTEEPDNGEKVNFVYDAIVSYMFEQGDNFGFSINGEFAHLTTSYGDDTPNVHQRVISGWADIWFLKHYGFLGRYDKYDPNIENSEDKDVGYLDEKHYGLAGFYFIPIKQVKLCLNWKGVYYEEMVTDDQSNDVRKPPDHYVYLNTELKFK